VDRDTPGKDHIDWRQIAATLRSVQFDGDVVVEAVTVEVPRIACGAQSAAIADAGDHPA
jgi:D-psicose/D-tagatose/L-ribulose 3-epimerase